MHREVRDWGLFPTTSTTLNKTLFSLPILLNMTCLFFFRVLTPSGFHSFKPSSASSSLLSYSTFQIHLKPSKSNVITYSLQFWYIVPLQVETKQPQLHHLCCIVLFWFLWLFLFYFVEEIFPLVMLSMRLSIMSLEAAQAIHGANLGLAVPCRNPFSQNSAALWSLLLLLLLLQPPGQC